MGDETPGGRLFARRRRANVYGGRQHRHEVKVSPEEEGMLLRLAEAQHVTIPRLLVESTLASAAAETPTERRNAMAELFRLHRLLAAVSNNVNQMARATNATGEAQAEMSATLAAVRRTAERIDAAIDGLSLS
ncbi:plasmid mobilization relaxosome protein MobC (plasmid) [Xylanimonas allomyrinae]|uniref:Plasmid mobilization relaxosome protein MobC n=1 Tax=Xylanimonas allomyrinae TaxID=2509459 RepID=A0A4V0YEQ2_9MICO|nr:plasmid mobilization relaxosome protein MobC [Xylanimonas allomyrinae]QAY65001.1 plasmid mobilization relaxosome protein MobC [Xylanimonas allomyrinae]